MKISFTRKAQSSLQALASYLLQQWYPCWKPFRIEKGYNVLYQHESEFARVIVLLVCRENIPLLD